MQGTIQVKLTLSCIQFMDPLYPISLVAQTVKNLPALRKTLVPSLDQENPLEKGMATHSSVLAWKILSTEEPGRLQALGLL